MFSWRMACKAAISAISKALYGLTKLLIRKFLYRYSEAKIPKGLLSVAHCALALFKKDVIQACDSISCPHHAVNEMVPFSLISSQLLQQDSLLGQLQACRPSSGLFQRGIQRKASFASRNMQHARTQILSGEFLLVYGSSLQQDWNSHGTAYEIAAAVGST